MRNEQIKRMYHSGVTGRELSALFGLDPSHIIKIAGPRQRRKPHLTPTAQQIKAAYRYNHIHDMRFKHHMGLRDIASVEGVSWQRIKQILDGSGGTGGLSVRIPYYYTLQNKEWLQEHAHMTNSEVAELLGMNIDEVQFRRAGTRYLPEHKNGRKGYIWENEIIKLLNARGQQAKGMPLKHPFDILVNDILRIDVKSCYKGLFTSKRALTPYLRFQIGRKKEACDIFICVDARDQANPVYFVIPSSEIKGNPLYLYVPTAKENGYYPFKERWDLIE